MRDDLQPWDAPPPQPLLVDIDLERALVALLFADNANLDRICALEPEDLTDPTLSAAFAMALALRSDGVPVTLTAMKQRLGAIKLSDDRTGLDVIRSLSVGSAAPNVVEVSARPRCTYKMKIKGPDESDAVLEIVTPTLMQDHPEQPKRADKHRRKPHPEGHSQPLAISISFLAASGFKIPRNPSSIRLATKMGCQCAIKVPSTLSKPSDERGGECLRSTFSSSLSMRLWRSLRPCSEAIRLCLWPSSSRPKPC